MYRSLIRLKRIAATNPQDSAALGLTFEITRQVSSSTFSTVELIPNGASTPVTSDNYRTYIHRYANYKLNEECVAENRAFLSGFRSLIPLDLIRLFSSKVS